jgi:hypothetical protein
MAQRSERERWNHPGVGASEDHVGDLSNRDGNEACHRENRRRSGACILDGFVGHGSSWPAKARYLTGLIVWRDMS